MTTIESTIRFILGKNAGSAYWNLSNQNITPEILMALLEKLSESPQKTPLCLDLDGNRLGAVDVVGFKKVFEFLCFDNLHYVSVRFGYDVFIPHYNKAWSEMTNEQRILLKNRVSVDIHWDSPLVQKVDSYSKSLDVSYKSIRGWQHHYDDSFETVITRCVKQYEENILRNNVEFLVSETAILNPVVPDECEVDGLLFRMVDNDVVAIIVIEAKENMDAKMLKRANDSYDKFQKYIRNLNTVELTKGQRKNYQLQVQTFQNIIQGNSNIEIIKYLGAHNWPMSRDGKDQRQHAIDNGWIVVERKAYDLYEIWDGVSSKRVEI